MLAAVPRATGWQAVAVVWAYRATPRTPSAPPLADTPTAVLLLLGPPACYQKDTYTGGDNSGPAILSGGRNPQGQHPPPDKVGHQPISGGHPTVLLRPPGKAGWRG